MQKLPGDEKLQRIFGYKHQFKETANWNISTDERNKFHNRC